MAYVWDTGGQITGILCLLHGVIYSGMDSEYFPGNSDNPPRYRHSNGRGKTLCVDVHRNIEKNGHIDYRIAYYMIQYNRGKWQKRHNRALSYTESLLLQYYLDCSNRWITASRLRDAELADANNNDKLASF